MGDLEKQAFNECYKFLARHIEKQDWNKISDEALAIEKKFNCGLASNLIYACIKHLEEKK